MDLSKILQQSIVNISPQVFLNRLTLFNLISNNEYEALQQKSHEDNSAITSYIIQRLNNETAVYYERFEIFLGYYKDLQSIYQKWEPLGMTHTLFFTVLANIRYRFKVLNIVIL